MSALVLPINTLLIFKVGLVENKITDHNRAPINITSQRIEYKKRMADGTLRSFVVVSQKRKWKINWTNVPKNDNQTVDGFWGAESIKTFYKDTVGSFDLILTFGDNLPQTPIAVMFDDFSCKLNKRSNYTDLYDIDLTLDEC